MKSVFACLLLLASTSLLAADTSPLGVISQASSHDVAETSVRLQLALQKRGMILFARIDHAANAREIGHELRDTELLIFGKPQVGSPLMACDQSVAIDLPQKALIWLDAAGQTWVSYNAPSYLQERHSIDGCGTLLSKIEKVLAALVGEAVK